MPIGTKARHCRDRRGYRYRRLSRSAPRVAVQAKETLELVAHDCGPSIVSPSSAGGAGCSKCSGMPAFFISRSKSSISASVKCPNWMLVLETLTFAGTFQGRLSHWTLERHGRL